MQTNPPVHEISAPELCQARSRFGVLLGSVYRQWRRQVDLSFKDLGLSDATRMPLLVLYVQDEPLRQKDLADALYLDTSSLVRVLAQLRKAQLIDWTNDPADRRTKCIALTPAGREMAALILAKSLEIEQTILADLSPHEQEVTRLALEKISLRFEALHHPAPHQKNTVEK
ncbi:MAG: winged helix DNA-binding protein [Burkholderiaceae bacterium]|nr:winged helix DNA-binding protein [Burkholderiaceae bacterium]